jgi:hypothetical protein
LLRLNPCNVALESAEYLVQHCRKQLVEVRGRYGLRGLGGVGFRLEAVKPELRVELWDWHWNVRKQFRREGLVADHGARRCFQDLAVTFLCGEVVIKELR